MCSTFYFFNLLPEARTLFWLFTNWVPTTQIFLSCQLLPNTVSLSKSIKVACCGHFEDPISMRPPCAWIKTCSSHVNLSSVNFESRHKNSGGVKEEISRFLTTPAVGLLRNGEQESQLCPVSLFCPLPAPDQWERPAQLTPHHHAPPETVKQISQGKGHRHLWLLRHSRVTLGTK